MSAANDKPMYGPDAAPAIGTINGELEYFEPGRGGPSIMSAQQQNKNRKLLNAFRRMRLNKTDDENAVEGFRLADGGMTLTLRSSSSGSSGGSGMVQTFALSYVNKDFLECWAYDENTNVFSDTITFIAKEWLHRNSLTTRKTENVTHTYTYTDSFDSLNINNIVRRDTSSLATEDQQLIPHWSFDEVIYAVPMTAVNLFDYNGISTEVSMIITNTSKQWARTS